MMKVLVVSPMLSVGGAERFTSTLLNHLDRKSFSPEVCLLFDNITYPLAPDVQVHLLGHSGARTVLRSIRRLRQIIEQRKPDVVLSTLAYTNIFAGEALHGCRHRPRWIARVANPPIEQHKGFVLRFVFARWQKRVYSWADHIVVISAGIADEIVNCFPFTAGRVHVIRNPTDFAWIDRKAAEPLSTQPKTNIPIILSVGRLVRQKRPDVLIDAFAHLRQRMVASLWICGDGPWREKSNRQIRASGLTESVHLLGFCDNPYTIMRHADLFVMSSDFEGLGNALIEAQGLGLPAVATRCPFGPSEIVAHGQTGLLVQPGDAEGLALAMEELLRDPQRRQQMAQAARERTRATFDLRALLPQWEQLLAGERGSRFPEEAKS